MINENPTEADECDNEIYKYIEVKIICLSSTSFFESLLPARTFARMAASLPPVFRCRPTNERVPYEVLDTLQSVAIGLRDVFIIL